MSQFATEKDLIDSEEDCVTPKSKSMMDMSLLSSKKRKKIQKYYESLIDSSDSEEEERLPSSSPKGKNLFKAILIIQVLSLINLALS